MVDKPSDVMWIEPDGSVHVEWDKLMNLGLPDDAGHGEYTEALGHRIWGIFHGIADNYGCHLCKHDAQVLISGIHDIVNVKLGKKVFNKKYFREFNEMVHSALEEKNAGPVVEHEIEEEEEEAIIVEH